MARNRKSDLVVYLKQVPGVTEDSELYYYVHKMQQQFKSEDVARSPSQNSPHPPETESVENGNTASSNIMRVTKANADILTEIFKKIGNKEETHEESLTEVSFSDSPTRHELCPASRLTSGGIVCGNLANALRHRNKRARPPHETGAEEMNVVDVEESTSDAPCAVPSSSEDEPSTSSASNGSMAAHSSDRLIDASRKWRQAFSLFKEKSRQLKVNTWSAQLLPSRNPH
ncbi:uncharacterized protein LOC113466278 [Diaphorina citri]|uniref:Uncharacterized protein LOC113466278 n=1 Tax=Diaphorina citri TaxID=121845 RepID=A0A3Q0ISM3_DIACI|nr:uncharacterized protein LOC113466278 [Diaphorina citri]